MINRRCSVSTLLAHAARAGEGHAPAGGALRRGRPVCRASQPPGGLLRPAEAADGLVSGEQQGRCRGCTSWLCSSIRQSTRFSHLCPSLLPQVPFKAFLPEEEEPGEPQASYSYALAEATARARGTMQGHEARLPWGWLSGLRPARLVIGGAVAMPFPNDWIA